MHLIVGLGNPGDTYEGTRHNLGFVVADEIRRKMGFDNWSVEKKFKGEVCKNGKAVLLRPHTYMNRSGMSVAAAAKYYKIPLENIIIIHDELDLQNGHIKLRLGGAAAGHHGVESIISSLNSDKFIRVRLGIGVSEAISGERHEKAFNAEHFVMEPFEAKEKSKVKAMIKKTITAVECILEKGIEKAQNQYN